MDKTAIKNFAIWARNELIKKVSQKAAEYGVRDKEIKDINDTSIDGKLLSSNELRQRHILIEKIEKQGFDNVIEEVAYTWFNRFIALRFMEVNGYLPSMIKVFTDENNDFNPEILSQAVYLDFQGLDKEKIFELKEKNEDEELFKYLLIAQCNDLNSILPGMFQKISDYTELLFPDNLLRDDSLISKMIKDIPEDDWKDQVQIIGWLYQYYNTEPKDKVFKELKKNKKITKEKIPAATQLFTPDWIVRYMVENSLGRLWVEGHPNEELKKNWDYFLGEAEQEAEVQKELDKIYAEYSHLQPQDITCIDPAMGSGHILVYMFDVFMQIYNSYGYNARDAVESIITNNLYGLDIDIRAYQLSYFSVIMKAREYDRRFLSRKNIPQPNLFYVKSSNKILENEDLFNFIVNKKPEIKEKLTSVLNEMKDADEYGSILNISDVNFELILSSLIEILKMDEKNIFEEDIVEIIEIVKIAKILNKKYYVVVTNPPYMGSSGMGPKIKKYVTDIYKDSKSDLFAVFMEKCSRMLFNNGVYAMITQHSWMFLSSYEKLRRKILGYDFVSMIHLGTRAFEEIGGEVVQSTAFIQRKIKTKNKYSKFVKLVEIDEPKEKNKIFLDVCNNKSKIHLYVINIAEVLGIPGSPIAYWASEKVFEIFKQNIFLGDEFDVVKGLSTGNVDKFTRLWFEVDKNKINFNKYSPKIKWTPYAKGGSYRKYYGNLEYVVDWENNGERVVNYRDERGKQRSRPQNIRYYFKEGATYSAISSSNISVRYINNYIFGGGGDFITSSKNSYKLVIALLNSNVAAFLIKFISPTLNFEVSHIKSIPVNKEILNTNEYYKFVDENILISKKDWDSFEVSWDFKKHPLINSKKTLKDAINEWANVTSNRFEKVKENQEIINKIIIKKYNLEKELSYKISDKENTIYLSNKNNDIVSLFSYYIGVLFGRYSLDEEGLVFAGGEFDFNNYKKYPADKEGIIPITEIEYFSNDIVSKLVQFIETVYSKKALEENLDFIAETLGGKGTSRDVIRNYFIKDFYKDHVKTYQKRPIYWMFDSGNKNAFKALIYMHRYEKDTIAKLRTDYIHPTQDLFRAMIEDLEMRKNTATSSEKIKIDKELKDLKDKETELREYEEKIHHLADQMIEIDLDDGVEHNYERFRDVLAKIK